MRQSAVLKREMTIADAARALENLAITEEEVREIVDQGMVEHAKLPRAKMNAEIRRSVRKVIDTKLKSMRLAAVRMVPAMIELNIHRAENPDESSEAAESEETGEA